MSLDAEQDRLGPARPSGLFAQRPVISGLLGGEYQHLLGRGVRGSSLPVPLISINSPLRGPEVSSTACLNILAMLWGLGPGLQAAAQC